MSTQIKQQLPDQIFSWWKLLIIDIILYFFGYITMPIGLGYVICFIAAIISICMFKNLVVEANIKALELFYGKKRFEFPAEKQSKNTQTDFWD